MRNYLKTSKWLRWVAATTFGLMLVLNIMVSLEFEKGNILPSMTLVEMGSKAIAQETVIRDCSTGGYADLCCPYWNITYPTQGPSSCTTGGKFKCNSCREDEVFPTLD